MTNPEELTFEVLETRLKTILPEEYQDCYDDIQPISMGSAGLKYGSDGKVSWDEIWGSFCDLAMAGGPPHKGTLLQAGLSAEIESQPARYQQVVDEICRGVEMVTGLAAEPSSKPGWIHVDCTSVGMAGWLLRAIIMENVSARSEGMGLYLPAGPDYRIEKEIKNVVTVIAKTSHYWFEHTSSSQHRAISSLFARIEEQDPLIQPLIPDQHLEAKHQRLRHKMAAEIQQATGLQSSRHQHASWLGFDCLDVQSAIWMMRALVVCNVLSRREGTTFFVPLNSALDPNGEIVVGSATRIHNLAIERNLVLTHRTSS